MSKTLGTVQAKRKARRADPTARKRYDSQDKANRWMITLNFGGCETPDDFEPKHTIALRRLNAAAQVPPTSYAIMQPERGEEGTYHVQAYFEFEKRMTHAQVMKHVSTAEHKCWIEPAKGTQDECIAYCSKEGAGGRVEGGELLTFGTPMKLNAQAAPTVREPIGRTYSR